MSREILPRPSVLVVDDEPLIRWSLTEALGEAGYVTRMAASGAEALVVLTSFPAGPLVVLLDMRLPDVNDLSLAREIRRRRADAPLILMSAHLSADDTREAMRLGIFRVVNKPFDVPDVVKLISQAYAGPQGPGSEPL